MSISAFRVHITLGHQSEVSAFISPHIRAVGLLDRMYELILVHHIFLFSRSSVPLFAMSVSSSPIEQVLSFVFFRSANTPRENNDERENENEKEKDDHNKLFTFTLGRLKMILVTIVLGLSSFIRTCIKMKREIVSSKDENNLSRAGDQVEHRNGDLVEHRNGDKVEDRTGDQVEDRTGDQVEDRIGDQVEHFHAFILLFTFIWTIYGIWSYSCFLKSSIELPINYVVSMMIVIIIEITTIVLINMLHLNKREKIIFLQKFVKSINKLLSLSFCLFFILIYSDFQ